MNGVSDIQTAITSAVEQTFINMAFIDVIRARTEQTSSDVSQLIVIDITKPRRGSILLRLPLALKRQVVENIHADSWEDLSAREIDDCLLEILNVLAGNYLHKLLGENVKYNITFPQIVFDEDEFGDETGFENYFYDAEGIIFEVSIRME
jgi:CheY-specific phosphatase CheX